MPSIAYNFPFSAVASQASFKLALRLVAVNPLVGGVLISGPRGSAKSTLAKGLIDILPRSVNAVNKAELQDDQLGRCQAPPFVTLPLGASEEMLIGSLNLQQVLNEKTVEFQPGLLAKAHNGVLYIDEVNLLPDNLVDQLLDVAASGVNTVERDGISHQHLANFILLGTMNPDEGELREQLTDRFGLFVSLTNQYDLDERIEIVQRREQFDKNPAAFVQHYAKQQQLLMISIAQAQALLPRVECPMICRRLIAERASAAYVDGLRADIVWIQAALAHAALAQRTCVTREDVFAVEELVLGHRRNNNTSNSPNNDHNDNNNSKDSGNGGCANQPTELQSQKPFTRPDNTRANHSEANSSGTNSPDNNNPNTSDPTAANAGQQQNTKGNSGQGDWGAMPAQRQQTQLISIALAPRFKKIVPIKPIAWLPGALAQYGAATQYSPPHTRNAHQATSAFVNGRAFCQGANTKIHWVNTLMVNLGQWPLKTLRFCQPKRRQSIIHLVLLDTSGSILANQGFAKAKGLILQIAEQAYLHREQFSLLGFGAEQVRTVMGLRRAPKAMGDVLDAITAGGGTPLHSAIEEAAKIQRAQLKKNPSVIFKNYIFTDGRIRHFECTQQLSGEVIVVDIEQSQVKRGKAKHIAALFNAQYLPLMV